MTTIRQIIIDAFREGGIVQVGLTPEADEFDEALRKMKALVRSLYGYEMGSPLVSVNYGDREATGYYNQSPTYYLPANLRLMFNSAETATIYLHPNPQDGARVGVVDVGGNFTDYPVSVHANGKLIGGSTSLSLETASENRHWFYRADLGEWTEVTNLTADSESPFPEEFDDLLITMLAMRLNPRYQATTAAETLVAYRRARSQFRSRYYQRRPIGSELALTRIGSPTNFTTGGSETSTSGELWDTGDVIFDGGSASG